MELILFNGLHSLASNKWNRNIETEQIWKLIMEHVTVHLSTMLCPSKYTLDRMPVYYRAFIQSNTVTLMGNLILSFHLTFMTLDQRAPEETHKDTGMDGLQN